MIEYLILLSSGLLGSALLMSLAPGVPPLWLAATSLPVGIVGVGLVLGVVSLTVGINAAGVPIVLAGAILAALIGALFRVRGRVPRSVMIGQVSLATVIPVVACVVLREWQDLSFILGDTLNQSRILHEAIANGWDASAGVDLRSWSFIYLGFGLAPAASGRVIYTLFGYSALVSLLLAAAALLVTFVRTQWADRYVAFKAAAVALVIVTTAASCFYLYLVLFFVSSNVLLAMYAGLFTACVISNEVAGEEMPEWQVPLLAVLLVGVAFSRAEGMIYFSASALWLLAATPRTSWRAARAIAAAGAYVLAIYLVQSTYLSSNEGGLLSRTQYTILALAAALWIPFAILIADRRFSDIVAMLLYLLACILLIAIVAGWYHSENFAISLTATGQNILSISMWGATPFLALLAAPAMAFAGGGRATQLAFAMLAVIVSIVLLLSFGRSPYYVDIGDSGHRIIGSFIPALLMAFMGAALMWLRTGLRVDADDATT